MTEPIQPSWPVRRVVQWAALIAVVVGVVSLPIAGHFDRSRGSHATNRATGEVTALQTGSLRTGRPPRVVVAWTDDQGTRTSSRFQTDPAEPYRVGQRVDILVRLSTYHGGRLLGETGR